LKGSHARAVDEILLQPWFLPGRTAFAIRRIVPPDYWNKMRYFFEDYGCMVCGKESDYHSNGMCQVCSRTIRRKLTLSVKRRLKSKPRVRLDLVLLRQEKLAKKLLGRFSPGTRLLSRRQRNEMAALYNPVHELIYAQRK